MCVRLFPGTYGKGNADAPGVMRRVRFRATSPTLRTRLTKKIIMTVSDTVSSRGEGGGGMGGRGTELAPPEPLHSTAFSPPSHTVITVTGKENVFRVSSAHELGVWIR